MTDYEFARLYVELAQRKRIESGIQHEQECTCAPCKVERAARRKMEDMSDHIREQKNWVFLTLEKLGRI